MLIIIINNLLTNDSTMNQLVLPGMRHSPSLLIKSLTHVSVLVTVLVDLFITGIASLAHSHGLRLLVGPVTSYNARART